MNQIKKHDVYSTPLELNDQQHTLILGTTAKGKDNNFWLVSNSVNEFHISEAQNFMVMGSTRGGMSIIKKADQTGQETSAKSKATEQSFPIGSRWWPHGCLSLRAPDARLRAKL